MMPAGVLIVAAGKGSRMKTTEKKQFLPLAGKPVMAWTVDVFEQMDEISEIVIVTSESDISRIQQMKEAYNWTKMGAIVAGGKERQDSVLNGLRSMQSDWVLVHDAVRPLVSPDAVRRCMQSAFQSASGGAVLGVQVKDTIKVVSPDGRILHTPERNTLRAVHTPQMFRKAELLAASVEAAANGWEVTDDASVMELAGYPVKIVPDNERNLKITTPDDLALAEYWLHKRMEETE